MAVPSLEELIDKQGDNAAKHASNRAKQATQMRHPDAREWQKRAHHLETMQRPWWKQMYGHGKEGLATYRKKHGRGMGEGAPVEPGT
jgi:hypothetical protein